MRKVIIVVVCSIISLPGLLRAQEVKAPDMQKAWHINEVYVSREDNYGLFVEIYTAHKTPVFDPKSFYLTTERSYPSQIPLTSKRKYNLDFRQRGYKTFRVSTMRRKRRTIKLYSKPDSLYLFEKKSNGFFLHDAFPVFSGDTLAAGKCSSNSNEVCFFNAPTPGRVNKNVDPSDIIPRRHYSITVSGGISTAFNTGLGSVGPKGAFALILRRITNRRIIYTTVNATFFQGGYTFNTLRVTPTANGELTRSLNGYYVSHGLWLGKEVGVNVTDPIDMYAGGGIVLASSERQVYTDRRIFIANDGTVTEESFNHHQPIGNYPLFVLTFSGGINYRLTDRMKFQASYNILFRTFEKAETIYHHTIGIGLSRTFNNKGRAYRDSLF